MLWKQHEKKLLWKPYEAWAHGGGLINECTPPNSLGAFLHGNNDNNSDNGNANDNEL